MKNELKRGKLLLTQTTQQFSHEEWVKAESQEKCRLYTDFFESNYGRSRQLVCVFEPNHPQYETLPDLIVESFNVANETGKTPRQLADDNKVMLEALMEAKLEIIYLHDKFKSTGSGNAVLAKIESAIKQVTE